MHSKKLSAKYVVVGASAAGIAAVVKLQQLDPIGTVMCLTYESESPYNKCFLADYLAGTKSRDALAIHGSQKLEASTVSFLTSTTVIALNAEKQQVTTANGITVIYEKLLLAIGGSVHLPELFNVPNVAGIFPFYTVADTENILAYARAVPRAKIVIVGAGLSGIECADALYRQGFNVTVIERAQHVLSAHIDQEGAQVIQQAMQQCGVKFISHTTAQSIVHEKNKVTGIVLADGTKLVTDMIICALGSRPNGWLGQEAELATHNGALITNDYLQTSNPEIFAAGDVAIVQDQLTGDMIKSCTWPDAIAQGAIAASNMAGISKIYPGVSIITSSAFFGMKFFVAGMVTNYPVSYNTLLCNAKNQYRKIVLENNIVKGFIVIGNTHHMVHLKRSLTLRQPLSPEVLEELSSNT